MKKLVKVEEIEGEGLTALLGKKVILRCVNYFYVGNLEGVNTTCVLLTNPQIVYNTGSHSDDAYADIEYMNMENLYVQIAAIECFGESK